MMDPYVEYCGMYGGGADDGVDRRRGTGGSSVHPWGSVNLKDQLLVALMPPMRRVLFLLDGAVSSSMLWGDSETECLHEDVVEDGLDNSDPFFLVKRLAVHMIAALSSLL
jgi:hypothetical protein